MVSSTSKTQASKMPKRYSDMGMGPTGTGSMLQTNVILVTKNANNNSSKFGN